MRKTVMVVSGLLLGVIVLVASILSQSGMVSWQPFNEKKILVEYSSGSATLSPNTLQSPGILPDNPFYLIKMLRDRIRIWLTIDPVEKAKLFINLANVRASAAYDLANRREILLAQSTIMKSYQYLEAAVGVLDRQPEGEQTDALRQSISRMIQTHLAMVTQMARLVEGDTRITFDKIMESYIVLGIKNQ